MNYLIVDLEKRKTDSIEGELSEKSDDIIPKKKRNTWSL